MSGISAVYAKALGLAAEDEAADAIIGYSVTLPDGHTSFFSTRRDAEEYRNWYLRVKIMVGDGESLLPDGGESGGP